MTGVELRKRLWRAYWSNLRAAAAAAGRLDWRAAQLHAEDAAEAARRARALDGDVKSIEIPVAPDPERVG